MKRVIVCLLLVACGGSEPRTPEEKFAVHVAAKARELLSVEKVEVTGRLEVTVTLEGGEQKKMILFEAFRDFERMPDRKDSIVWNCLREVTDSVQLEETMSQVLPVLRNEKDLSDATGQGELDLYREPLAADVWIAYAFDAPDAFRMMTNEDRKRLPLPDEEIRARAIENLLRAIPEPELVESGGVFRVDCGGELEPGLLLVGSVWEEFAGRVSGKILVGVPAENTLLFTGLENRAAVERLRSEVKSLSARTAHSISKSLLVREEGEWRPYW
jgi:uncharacterized protein YtpQ (UPF0354 family)